MAEDSILNDVETSILSITHTPFNDNDSEIVDLYEDFAKQSLLMIKDVQFRREVLKEALLQRQGEYEFHISDLKSRTQQKGFENIEAEEIEKLLRISNKISEKNSNDIPVIFYPRAETIERDKVNVSNLYSKSSSSVPIAVFKNVYNSDYDSPGYILNEDGELVFSHMVSEEEAWNEDVYVIGAAERNVQGYDGDGAGVGGSGDQSNNDTGNSSSQNRNEGHAEFGGIIQITDLNEVEHWTAGKLEMRIIVVSAGGTTIKDKEFDKRARSNYRNNRWGDKNEFLYNWNTPNIGQFVVERWIEVDGGASAQVAVTIPASNGNPATTVTLPSGNRDDDLGQSIVQFSDQLGQVYGISHMNFRRK